MREASAKQTRLEDEASSARMRLFLGCGKTGETVKNPLDNVIKRSELVISERTSADNSNPEVQSLGYLVEGRGGKRHLIGGTESPSKRLKQAEKFKNLRAFWSGGREGVVEHGNGYPANVENSTHIIKEHHPTGKTDTGNLTCSNSDNLDDDMGLEGNYESERHTNQLRRRGTGE